MYGIELLSLMLRDLEHLHGQDTKTIFLELLDDIANCILGHRVWFDNSKSPLESLHSSVVCPWCMVLSLRRNTHSCYDGFADFGGRFGDANARRFHCLNLFSRSSLPAGNNCAGMAHAASRRRGLSRDKSYDRFLHARLHIF